MSSRYSAIEKRAQRLLGRERTVREVLEVLDVPAPAFMLEPEIQMFADSANRFFERAEPPDRIAGWRAAGEVEREFWRETGAAGVLGVMVPEAYGGAASGFWRECVFV